MNEYSPESFEKKDLPFHVKRLSPSIGGEIHGVTCPNLLGQN